MRLLLPLLLAIVASAADYYVSPSGNDANAGTSTAAPWRTVAKVNGRSFAAGDRIYFQGGQVFSDAGLQVFSDDTGSAGSPIVIGSYGTGRATLSPPASAHGIDIYNTAGLHVRDLILVGPGLALSDTNGKRGLQAYCDLAGGVKLSYLRVENLDISGFHEGITIGAWHASFSGFRDVVITGCTIHDNLGNGITSYGYQPGSASQQSHANLQIVSSEIMRNYGDPTLTNPAGQHSGSGIIISGTKGALVDRCYVHNNGGSAGDNAGGGPVGIWTYASDSVVIQRSLVHDQKTTTGAADGGGFDIDGGATNAIVQYCYSYSNEGPGYLVAEYTGATPLQNGIFRYNVSWRDGRRMAMASGFHFWSGENLTSECQDIRVYNNLVYTENASGGACVTYQSGPMAGLRMWNNIFVVQGGERFVDIGSNTGYFTFQGNLYWATDAVWTGGWRWGATTYTSLAAWRAAAGTPETLAGSPVGVQADPLVASLVAGAQPTTVAAMEAMTTFKLLAASPAINAGADLRTATYGSLNIGTRDFWNNALPVGGAFDIGPQERTWEVGYDSNGATSGSAPAVQAKNLGVNLTLAANSGSLVRSGYVFNGWNTAADGSGTGYSAGGSYSADASAMLYAHWLPVGGSTAPTITTTKPASLTVNEDTAGTVSLSATDANGDTLTWSVLTQGTKGTASASGTGSPKVVTYTPTANLNGSDSFVVQVSDGNGGTDTITVNVTITAVNDTPLATAQSVSVTEDTAKPITLAGSDVEGSTLTYAIGTAPTKGVLSGTAPSLTYTPNLNATGSDSFTFTVNDGTATSAAATVSITITAVNDPPVNSVAPTTSGKSTVGRVQTATSGTWSDSDGSVTGYAYQWQRSIGGGAYADIIGATTATYTPLAGDAGFALRVQVTASDNGTPGIASAAAVSSPTVVKVKSSSPTVTTSMTQATATPSVAGSGEFSATIRVYDGSVLIGTVTVDGGGSWTWTPGTPLTPGTHLLMVTAELSPSGESSDVGPIVVNAPSGGTGTAVVATAGNGGGGCGAGGLAGILAMGLTLGLMRRRYSRSDDAEGGAGGAIP
jgi:hypothetical protein